jgi:hypothetical protein
MREPITAAKSSSTEISAELKPVAPFWQRIVAMMFVVGGVGSFTLLLGSWWSVVFSVSVLAGMGAVLAYWSRDKTVKVTIVPADDCVLINDPSRPGLGKLIPSLVVQEDDMRIRVERTGRRWELKRMELRFSTPEDTSKAAAMLARFLCKS